MKRIVFKIMLVLMVLSQYNSSGQEVIVVSKQKLIEEVQNKNLSFQMSQKDVEKAKASFSQTNAIYLPTITASHTGISTTNPLMAFGSRLNQGIITQNDFNPSLLNNPTQTQNFATILKIEQPLINLDGLYKRKAAKSKMDAMSLKSKRTKEYLVLEIDKAYMQLQLAYKGVEVLEKALKTAETTKEIATNNFNEGYLQRADILNVDIRLTEVKNQLQTAKSNIQNASNYLSFLINDKTDVLYKPKDSLWLSNLSIDDKNVSENRSDIKAMELGLKGYEALNKADKMAFLPRLNAFGSYEMYDNNAFQGNANGYVIGAQLSWDIFKGSKRFGKLKKSKAVLEKSKLAYMQYVSKSNLELNKIKRQLVDAKNKLELTALAVEQSKESLRIRKNRFKEGLEKTSDLLQAETQLIQKELEYYQTIFEYNFTQAYVTFLTKE